MNVEVVEILEEFTTSPFGIVIGFHSECLSRGIVANGSVVKGSA